MKVFLNGKFVEPEDAHVSVMDRGFLFGDGVYEVIPVYSRRPFRLDEHLSRLQQSLDGIRLANPHDPAGWRQIITRLIDAAPWPDQSIYLQLTRGPMAVRNHAFPAVVTPTVLAMAEPLVAPPTAWRDAGVAAVTAADIRWLRCDLKTTSLLANCLLRQVAVDQGCVETVLLRDGWLTEGAASNIFVVKAGRLLAPPKSRLMLPGITYDIVLEIAAQLGLATDVREIAGSELVIADELWLTSSTREVVPIVKLDGQPVGSGRPGALFQRMHEGYQAFKANVMRGGDA